MAELHGATTIHLKNLTIYDGTGDTPFTGDLLIRGGKIAAVGQVDISKTYDDIVSYDCKGLSASPGFIDIHSHSDGGILQHPDAECLVRQGITTTIGGNCGSSAGGTPLSALKEQTKYRELGLEWRNFAEFLDTVLQVKPAVNIGLLFGHGDVRNDIVGGSGAPLKSSEKAQMVEISREHMKAGAFGVSSGLEYVPGRFADIDELAAISKPVAEYNGIHAMHMRNEAPQLLASIEEAIQVAKKSGVRFEISHLKAVGPDNWGLLPKALDLLDAACSKGIDISADVYPYLASSTELPIVLPDWVLENGKKAALNLLAQDSPIRGKIIDESHARTKEQGGWDKVVITSVENARDKWMEGLAVDIIARKEGKLPQEKAIDILLSSAMRVRIIRHSMDENDLIAAIQHPKVCFVTDGSLTVESEGSTHPRSIGTFPRVLGRYVREKGVLTAQEAIRKMTSLPAEKMKIENRGTLKSNFFADVVIFDLATISDRGTYEAPWQYPSGIFAVFVNGRPTIWDGKVTGLRTGSVLKHG